MDKKIKGIKIITIITLVIMFVCIIIFTCQLIKITNLKKETHNLQIQKEELIEDINNYNTANSYNQNNRAEFLEDYARDELGWEKTNEKWYIKK